MITINLVRLMELWLAFEAGAVVAVLIVWFFLWRKPSPALAEGKWVKCDVVKDGVSKSVEIFMRDPQ